MEDRIGVSLGVTLNMGNYETVRVESLFHTDRGDESAQEVYAYCLDQARVGLEMAMGGVRKSYDKFREERRDDRQGKSTPGSDDRSVHGSRGPARPRRNR